MPDNIELINARDFPKTYYARHMEPGLCGYENEKILVDTEAMKNMAASFQGKPVYVGHQKVDVSKIQEQADGYVTECFYNELDGWLWAKMIVVSDKGNDAVAQGWSVSNAYVPSEFASGGQHHAVDFNRKIVNAIFTHLAIVPDPRYEGAKIFTPDEFKSYCAEKRAQLDELKNSKGAKKMFKKLFKTESKEVTNAADIDDSTMVELQNGKSVSLKEMIEAVTAAEELKNAKTKKNDKDGEKEEKEGDKEKLNADTEVDVGGQKMPLGHLMNKYMNVQKENAAEEEEKKKKEEAEKKNADDKKKEEEEKANAKTFEEMKNAKSKTSSFVQVDTSLDQVARGQDRYGSKK